jgi:hypothetical protein
MLEFVIVAAVGALLVGILARYWEDIRRWLNTTAADAVERALGYEARRNMHMAVSVADRVFRMFQGRAVATNVSTVFTLNADNTYGKVQMLNNIPAEELGQEYLNEMRTADNVMEMDYRS